MKKTKFILIIFSFCVICCNSKTESKKQIQKTNVEKKVHLNITITDSKLPLFIEQIDFENNENQVRVNDGIESEISNLVSEFISKEFENEEITISKSESYFNTIRMNYDSYALFLVILKSYPTQELTSKHLIYNNLTKEFIGNPIDFKIYALYDFENGKIKATNLKKTFNIENPEIEILKSTEKENIKIKLNRLFHNGTFNAIESQIIIIKDNKVEILKSEQKAIEK